MRKDMDFGMLENADKNEIVECAAPVTEQDKNRVGEMSIKASDSSFGPAADDDTVSGSEPFCRRHSVWKYVGTAAVCLALIGCAAGGAVLFKNNEGGNSQLTGISDSVTEYIEEHAVFFRKGDRSDGEILLTGKNIRSAEPILLAGSDPPEYLISAQLDQEGTAIFSAATAELAGTDIPISVWIDGECIFSPKINTSITDGIFTISGDFTPEKAVEIADLLASSGNVPDPQRTANMPNPVRYDSDTVRHCRC